MNAIQKSLLLNLASYTLLCAIFSYLLLFSCSEPTTPPDDGPDTTSHNFTWGIDTLGDYGSYLKDVFVIDKNNIWAVGEIQKKNKPNESDSVFSLAHWNGTTWKLKQVYLDNGWLRTNLQGIWVIDENDMWFASGSVYHWNGQVAEISLQREYSTDEIYNRLWYNNDSDIYAVGNAGYIAHYNGATWTRLESGTDIRLLDVWGSPDGSVVWACGYSDFKGTILLKIVGQQVETVYEDLDHWFTLRQDSLSGVLTSLWTNSSEYVYVVTPYGIYKVPEDSKGNAERNWYNNQNVPGFPRTIRAQSYKDLFIAGDFHMISHYNGSTWRYFEEFRENRATWVGSSFRNNVFASAGWLTEIHKAVVKIGIR